MESETFLNSVPLLDTKATLGPLSRRIYPQCIRESFFDQSERCSHFAMIWQHTSPRRQVIGPCGKSAKVKLIQAHQK